MRELDYTNPESLSEAEKLWAYNGLDTSVTREIWDQILPQADPTALATYRFEKRLLGPAFDMMKRGLRVDPIYRAKAVARLTEEATKYQGYLDRIAVATWGQLLNASSPKQLQEFFYGYLRQPVQYRLDKGRRVPSCGREQLTKIADSFSCEPFVNLILAVRDKRKELSFIQAGLDPDGRMRCTYSVAGTETGRWSSYSSGYDTGTNLQNLPDYIRDMFIADPGYKLAYLDLAQAESRIVGAKAYAISGLRNYLDACHSGDLHTFSARLIWPGLPWTESPADNKQVAERSFYRHFSYRDMSKRGGHATNYYGKPYTVARHLKVPKALIENFQEAYLRQAFPEIPIWHQYCAQELQLRQELTTCFGRRRYFFGRPEDDTTLREAIAYEPQSTVGDVLNLGMDKLYRSGLAIQLLAQIHDAILFQYPESMEDEILAQVPSIVETELCITGSKATTRLTIPCDIKTGWNFRTYHPKNNPNPDSLQPYKGSGQDKRTRQWDPAKQDALLSLVH